MQKKKTAIFDLDHTLLDTTELRKEILKILGECGLKSTEAAASLQAFMDKNNMNYDMLAHCEELMREKKLSSLDKIHQFLASPWEKHLIQNAKKTIEELRKRNYYLILLTKGIERFQKTKIAQTGLAPFLDEIHIVPKFKEEELEKINPPAGSYFINDSVPETERVMRVHPNLKYILVGTNSETKPIPSVTTLGELLNIIQ